MAILLFQQIVSVDVIIDLIISNTHAAHWPNFQLTVAEMSYVKKLVISTTVFSFKTKLSIWLLQGRFTDLGKSWMLQSLVNNTSTLTLQQSCIFKVSSLIACRAKLYQYPLRNKYFLRKRLVKRNKNGLPPSSTVNRKCSWNNDCK